MLLLAEKPTELELKAKRGRKKPVPSVILIHLMIYHRRKKIIRKKVLKEVCMVLNTHMEI